MTKMRFVVALSLFLSYLVAVQSYCNPFADLCAAAGLACPSTSENTCNIDQSGVPIDFNYFDVLCFGFLYLPAGFIKGRAAMGHDFNVEQENDQSVINIGEGLTESDGQQTYSFVCASDITWNTGELFPKDERAIVSGRIYATPPDLDGRLDTCESGGSCLNDCIDKSEDYYKEISSLVEGQPTTTTATVSGGVLQISCSDSLATYIISLSSNTFNDVTSYSIDANCNLDAYFVFNIRADTDNVVFDGTPISGVNNAIYHILGSGHTLDIRTDVYGSILSVGGDVNQASGTTIFGWLISDQCRALTQIDRPLCYGNNPSTSSTGTVTGAVTGVVSGIITADVTGSSSSTGEATGSSTTTTGESSGCS